MKNNASTSQEQFYFNCYDVEQSHQNIPSEKTTECTDFGIPPIHNRYNIHNGPTPYIAIPVEDIPEYFTDDDWRDCVNTIRTIGIVRRLEYESYVIEAVNSETKCEQVPLSRGTNRELKFFRNTCRKKKSEVTNRNNPEEAEKAGASFAQKNTTEAKSKLSVTELPFPDSVHDPLSLGDTRVRDGATYMVLGTLRWANGKPIIDVHRFIPVQNLKTTYEVFLLQCRVSRKHVDFYKAHHADIGKVVRRPYEVRDPLFARPQQKSQWQRRENRKK